MHLIQPYGTLTTLLCAVDVEPTQEDMISEAGFEYARIVVHQMIIDARPLQEIVDLFGQDFATMSPLARRGVEGELGAIAHHALSEFRREAAYAGLDAMLDDVWNHGLLGEFGTYRVTRWLAEEMWAADPERALPVHDDLESQIVAAQTVLVTAAMACRTMYDPPYALEDYIYGTR